jgi:ABC-2 type transport system ATP-binding protein
MIRFNHLSKSFRRVRVLDGIDLSIGLGERVALIGSNGAGKTTLIRCLLGEYTHDGEVLIQGRNPRLERTEVLGLIGFVPVDQLINFSASLCNTEPLRIHEVAIRLGLDLASILSRPFNKLSGGMKQKLLIAIALGRDARVLVMDEPAANLDPQARKIFFDLLSERAESVTMLISSHRINEVSALVTRVVELDTGKVVLDDRVTAEISLAGILIGRVVSRQREPALIKALEQWNFKTTDTDANEWAGQVAGPDRLRFLGMVSRYAAVVSHVSLTEINP